MFFSRIDKAHQVLTVADVQHCIIVRPIAQLESGDARSNKAANAVVFNADLARGRP